MNAKEYLNGVRQMRIHCRMLYDRRNELYAQAQGMKAIAYDADRVQTSPRNSMEELIVTLEEMGDEYASEIRECVKATRTASRQIRRMKNQAYADVLRLRYMVDDECGRQMSIERIACEMCKSYEWVRHIHGNALREFERLYLKDDTKQHI